MEENGCNLHSKQDELINMLVERIPSLNNDYWGSLKSCEDYVFDYMDSKYGGISTSIVEAKNF